MPRMKELLAAELKKKLDSLSERIEERARELKSIENRIHEKRKKKKLERKFAVERRFGGKPIVLQRKGYGVGVFSVNGKDLSQDTLSVLEGAYKLSQSDFVLDGELVDNQFAYVWDAKVLENESIDHLPWYERRRAMKRLCLSDSVRLSPVIIVDNKSDAVKAIRLLSKLKGNQGKIVVRSYASAYDGKRLELSLNA